MSAYTIVNLMELDDVISNRTPGIEGRFARPAMESRDLGVSHWRYQRGVRSGASHRHGEQEEAYIVLAGSGRVRLDDELRDIRQWDVVRVAPQTLRAFEAGPDGLELLVVGGARPADGEGELVRDEWPEG